jgi:acyl-CoA thioester hydrolase
MVVKTPYRVIYGDTDQMGVMYYANYFRLFEMGRNEYLRTAGLTYKEIEARGFIFPITNASCRYLRSARYDDLIILETRVTSAKGARIRFAYDLRDEQGQLLAQGETEHANLNQEGRTSRIDPEIVAILDPVS